MTDSQNPAVPDPFGAFGGAGGFDMNALLQQAQQMQEQLQAAQDRLADATAEGTVGAVTVTVTGVGELAAVKVAPGSFDAADEESLADLGDMIVAAYRDAKAKADGLASEALGPLAGGLPGMPGAPGGGQPGQLGF